MKPAPSWENIIRYLIHLFNFDLSFDQPNETDFISMQEDLELFLFIRPIKAPDIPTANDVHWGEIPPKWVQVQVGPKPLQLDLAQQMHYGVVGKGTVLCWALDEAECRP